MREVPGFDGYYADEGGAIYSALTGQPVKLKPRLDRGYWVVTIKAGPGVLKRRKVPVHRMVCAAFHGPATTDRPIARHLDDNTSNNTPGNLAWGTHADNASDAKRNGRLGCGMLARRRKLTEDEAVAIIAKARAGVSSRRIAEEYGIHYTYVQHLQSGRTWPHLARG